MPGVVREARDPGAPSEPTIVRLVGEGVPVDHHVANVDHEARRPLSQDPTYQRAVARAIEKTGNPAIDDGSVIERGLE